MGIGIGIGIGNSFFRRGGGVDWSTYWATRNAYFALPATGVSLMVGQEVTIYGDSLINVPIDNPLVVTYTCDIGTQVGNNLVITPEAGDAGDHSLRVVFKNGSYTIEDKTIALTVYGEAPAGAKKVLTIGDSWTYAGMGNNWFQERIENDLDNCTFTWLGLIAVGNGDFHEGHGGATWKRFAENDQPVLDPSPFFKAGVLDVEAYFVDNSIDTPDYVYIMLGVNDTFGGCAIAGDGLTDLEIATIIATSKILIDGLLAYDADLKIILGIPGTADNMTDSWEGLYNDVTYSKNLYIDNTFKYQQAFIEEFANGAYDARVDCSYGVIFLDRANYLNTIHPNEAGYLQIGGGMVHSLNKALFSDLKPTGVTATWAEDHATISFTDSTGGAAQHEIWESKNGGDYELVTTLDAGTVTYDNHTWQNASMNFRVRAKSGSWYSDFTAAVALQTPLVLQTDQTTLTNVVISQIRILTGKTVNVDWGDSTNQDLTGNNSNLTKSYSVEADPYYIIFSGDTDSIDNFILAINQAHIKGDIGKWVMPTPVRYYQFYNSNNTGDISKWVLASTLIDLSLVDTLVTGDISDWVIPANCVQIYINNTSLEGDLSGWLLPAVMIRLYAQNANFTGLPRGELVGIDAVLGLDYTACNCATAEVDAFLVYANTYFATHTPIKNAKYILGGSGMGIPSATGLAAKTGIEQKYTAAGFTATITVNS